MSAPAPGARSTLPARLASRLPLLAAPAALLGSLLLGLALIAATGVPLGEAVAAFWDGIVGSDYALVGSLNRAIPLALVGLGFILADRANLTNVGGEGQICLGGMFATWAALEGGAEQLPAPLAWLFPLALGTLAGGLWGAIAGLLRARRGSNEVITTLLLTFIALQMVYGSVQSERAAAPAEDRLVHPARVAAPARPHPPAGAVRGVRLAPPRRRRHRARRGGGGGPAARPGRDRPAPARRGPRRAGGPPRRPGGGAAGGRHPRRRAARWEAWPGR